MMSRGAVDIVLPVFNEERALPGCVKTLLDYLCKRFPFDWTITVVDNASTDDTLDVARALLKESDALRLIHLDRKGRGLALKEAWSRSEADVVVYMDVDLSTGLDALLPLVAPLLNGHSDLAIGSRLAPGARTVRQPLREFVSRTYNGLIRLTHQTRISDAQCGFKAARTEVIRPLLAHVTDDWWFFDTELLLLAEYNELRVHEVPVDWVEDADSRVNLVRTAWGDLRGLVRVARAKSSGAARVAGLPRRPEPRAAHPDAVLGRPRAGLSWQVPAFAMIGVVSTVLNLVLYALFSDWWPVLVGHRRSRDHPQEQEDRVTAVTVQAQAKPVSTGFRWQPWAVAAICVLAGVLYGWNIGSGGFGNSYYAAAVKSMSTGLTNFLFGSFDPAGVVTVDKPPMALWPQVVSVWIFGFHGWSVLLPQVLEGVAAVFVLHRTVRLWAGEHVALLAAALFTLTPITVAINRDNNPDTLLVLLLVISAYAFTRATRADRPRERTSWLLWCAFFVGCAFVTKMLQAWIVVPGIALAYLVGGTSPVRRRVLDLLGAGVVLVVSSFWWTALHDLWPGDKPYMGGSTDGTAWNLIFGYNGFGRIFGESLGRGGAGRPPVGAATPDARGAFGGGGMFGGGSGITRMFGEEVGGQISWLLPLALLVLAVVAVTGVLRWRARQPGDPAGRAGWFLWGGWLLITALVFSYAQGIWHPYYTTMLAPAISAICAAGLRVLWRRYRHGDGVSWVLLPLAVAITAAWAYVLVSRDPSWHGWTRWVVLVIAVGGLALGRLGFGGLGQRRRATIGRAAIVLGLVSMLLTPSVWSVATAAQNNSLGAMPAAGPPGGMFGGRGPQALDTPQGMRNEVSRLLDEARSGRLNIGGARLAAEQQKILDYARAHSGGAAQTGSGGAAITLAVEGGAMTAAPFLIATDDVVIGMGGFSGTDNAPSVTQLEQWVREGKLKFVLGGGRGGSGRGGGGFGGPGGGFGGGFGGGAAAQERASWIERNCQVVNPSSYGGTSTSDSAAPGFFPGAGNVLYTCTA